MSSRHSSTSKSKSGLSDSAHQLTSSLCAKHFTKLSKIDQLNRKRAISNPLSRQVSKETKRPNRLFNSRRSSNRSRLSSSSQGVYRLDRHRRKALKLLIVIIVEFFVCWTPLFIYHTFGTFDKKFYRSMPTIFVDLILLFSFASPLCNPFTYYFMSKRYRAVLYAHLSCFYWRKDKNEKFNKKNEQVIKALRLHQQQNSLEYKQKSIQQKLPSTNDQIYSYPKLRSNTLQ
jgi:hypothetical protein